MNKCHWTTKKISEFTIEDALEANSDGADFICGDGKLTAIGLNFNGTISANEILNILCRKAGI